MFLIHFEGFFCFRVFFVYYIMGYGPKLTLANVRTEILALFVKEKSTSPFNGLGLLEKSMCSAMYKFYF
jgi:hypothetical protein